MSCSTVADRCLALAAVLGALAAAGCGGGEPADPFAELSADDARLFATILATEDARLPGAAGEQPLIDALQSDNPALRRMAVRALGRLERAGLVDVIADMLDDRSPGVRTEAANALPQAVYGEASATARDALLAHFSEASDAATKGAIGQALGRLSPVSAQELASTEQELVEHTRDAPAEQILGIARGLESLARGNARDATLRDETVARLGELTRYGRSGAEGHVDPEGDEPLDPELTSAQARIRRLALATLVAARRLDPETVETALYDPDNEVRRLAALAAGRLPQDTWAPLLIDVALDDASAQVRFEALRGYGSRLQATAGCGPVIAAVDDPDDHVALQAIDLLGNGCESALTGTAAVEEGDAAVASFVGEIAASLPGLPGPDPARDGIPPPVSAAASAAAPSVAWHRPAHALVTLAKLDNAAAARLIPAYSGHPTWQVRMYAARAAAITGSSDSLERLVNDPHPNVVSAALGGLRETMGRLADGSAVRALDSDDYQTLLTAAQTLRGTENPDALDALIAALDRVSAQRRETSRDPRRAMLERIGELGDAGNAGAVAPYLNDFDPAIAPRAAEILTTWTGEAHDAAPQPLEAPLLPTLDELLSWQRARVSMIMEDGGVIEMRLLPFEAPTNVARFARQASSGHFEGLTFHRIAPNFVIQGTSPGANEYVGAGPFSRDELTGRSHVRGTVGISTRGRDTGDSQIFVNLVDNVRLDHNYTIIAEVTSGMEVVDRALEGAAIARVDIVIEDDASR